MGLLQISCKISAPPSSSFWTHSLGTAAFCSAVNPSGAWHLTARTALCLRQLGEAKQPSPLLFQRALHCVLHGQALLQNRVKSEGSGKRSAIVWLCCWAAACKAGTEAWRPHAALQGLQQAVFPLLSLYRV